MSSWFEKMRTNSIETMKSILIKKLELLKTFWVLRLKHSEIFHLNITSFCQFQDFICQNMMCTEVSVRGSNMYLFVGLRHRSFGMLPFSTSVFQPIVPGRDSYQLSSDCLKCIISGPRPPKNSCVSNAISYKCVGFSFMF